MKLKRSLKIMIVAVASVAVPVAGVATAASLLGDRKANRIIEVDIAPVAFSDRPADLRHGKYLYESRGCMDCHAANGKGRVVIDDPGGLYVRAPNITTGPGGVVASYADRDWVRTLRHGVKPNGRPLLVMPSEDYNQLTDGDLNALVAYVRSLPPVDGEGAVVRLPLIAKAMYAFGGLKDAPEKIDHSRLPPEPVPVGATARHGAYVANMCIGCHGASLTGGRISGSPPDWPAAADITSGAGSAMQRYDTVDRFRNMMRTGKRPDGSRVSQVMPFAALGKLSDVDVDALYAFLKTLSPQVADNR